MQNSVGKLANPPLILIWFVLRTFCIALHTQPLEKYFAVFFFQISLRLIEVLVSDYDYDVS